MLKFCRGCSQDLPQSAFAKRADRPAGVSSRCRKCLSANLRNKYQDPEFAAKDKARANKWVKDNPEIRRKTAKAYLNNNPEQVAKVNERSKRWYEGNKEKSEIDRENTKPRGTTKTLITVSESSLDPAYIQP